MAIAVAMGRIRGAVKRTYVPSDRNVIIGGCMRPVGSKNGRVPEGGYPSVDRELGGFLAGFMEGEACFTIARQTRGYGYRCVMSLNVRDDDASLLHELAEETRLGRVGSVAARPTSRPQTSWRVSAKSDCRRLVELLYAYPFRGRRARDFAIWAAAANWWVGEDATARRPSGEWGPMPECAEDLKKAKKYGASSYSYVAPDPEGLVLDWPQYLAGFVTAEGCLEIDHTAGGSFRPRLTLRQRADDGLLLREICARTHAGKVYGPYESPGVNPVVNWTVMSRADLERLVEVFDSQPLRGRKRTEYALWRRAVEAYASSPAVRAREMASLAEQLRQARAYTRPSRIELT